MMGLVVALSGMARMRVTGQLHPESAPWVSRFPQAAASAVVVYCPPALFPSSRLPLSFSFARGRRAMKCPFTQFYRDISDFPAEIFP